MKQFLWGSGVLLAGTIVAVLMKLLGFGKIPGLSVFTAFAIVGATLQISAFVEAYREMQANHKKFRRHYEVANSLILLQRVQKLTRTKIGQQAPAENAPKELQ